jgi:hypothetical protein
MLGDLNSEFCWTTPDAAPPTCVEGFTTLFGWSTATDVLVVADAGANSRLGLYNLPRKDFVAFEPAMTHNGDVLSSRDGNWIAMMSRDSVTGEAGWIVFPVDAPDQTKQVHFAERHAENQMLALLTPGYRQAYLDLLTVVPPSTALPSGVPLLLHATGTDIEGRRIPLFNLSWSGGGASATVERTGVITPDLPGQAIVSVSAGGWREDSRDIAVAEARFNPVFLEDWSDGWDSRWKTYGVPNPLVTSGPDSILGFWNNGDRSFTSGAYSTGYWPADSGLGIEALISTLITAPHQQKLTFTLSGWIDSTRVAAWDHQTGPMPGRDASSDRSRCQVWYPDREAVRERELFLAGGSQVQQLVAPLAVDTGEWHRVRLQIFPDGTCGLAINGQVIARSTERVPLDAQYRIWTEGASLGSKMLVGPLEVWTGTKTDVDWSNLDWPP